MLSFLLASLLVRLQEPVLVVAAVLPGLCPSAQNFPTVVAFYPTGFL